VFVIFIEIVSQCVYCVCYVCIKVLDFLSEEMCDKSGIEGEEKGGENPGLTNVNEEVEEADSE